MVAESANFSEGIAKLPSIAFGHFRRFLAFIGPMT
jgi:hypothetical protein